MIETVLTGTALRKNFGSTVALAGVDFGVQRGETVAIMGPSGSGKSTLLHCLAGIMRPDAGQVRLLDQRIDTMSEARRSRLRRTRFGFLFQFGQLLPELSAVENVALPLMLGGVGKSAALRDAHKWFPILGLDGLHKRRPGELSGGQAQRVALARALVSGPAVVFADEPTGALDQTTGAETMRTLVASTKGQQASLVVVTHDAAVASHCDRTMEIRDGLVTSNATGGPTAHSQSPPLAADSHSIYPATTSSHGPHPHSATLAHRTQPGPTPMATHGAHPTPPDTAVSGGVGPRVSVDGPGVVRSPREGATHPVRPKRAGAW